jgi:hypothetical protein
MAGITGVLGDHSREGQSETPRYSTIRPSLWQRFRFVLPDELSIGGRTANSFLLIASVLAAVVYSLSAWESLTGRARLSPGLLPSISRQLIEVLGGADIVYLGQRFVSLRRSRAVSANVGVAAPT